MKFKLKPHSSRHVTVVEIYNDLDALIGVLSPGDSDCEVRLLSKYLESVGCGSGAPLALIWLSAEATIYEKPEDGDVVTLECPRCKYRNILSAGSWTAIACVACGMIIEKSKRPGRSEQVGELCDKIAWQIVEDRDLDRFLTHKRLIELRGRIVHEIWKAKDSTACSHENLRFVASTGAQLKGDGGNVEVGITAHCDECEEYWTGDVVAGCPEAYGRRSSSTPRESTKLPDGEGAQGDGFSRFTVSITRSLHSKVKEHREINWSRVCRDAIQRELGLGEEPQLEIALTREMAISLAWKNACEGFRKILDRWREEAGGAPEIDLEVYKRALEMEQEGAVDFPEAELLRGAKDYLDQAIDIMKTLMTGLSGISLVQRGKRVEECINILEKYLTDIGARDSIQHCMRKDLEAIFPDSGDPGPENPQDDVVCDTCGDESNSDPGLKCGRHLGKDDDGEETLPPHCDGTYHMKEDIEKCTCPRDENNVRRESAQDCPLHTPKQPGFIPLAELIDLLGLVMSNGMPTPHQLAHLSQEERRKVVEWACTCHLEASDNDVVAGPAPKCLRNVLPEGHYLHTWRRE